MPRDAVVKESDAFSVRVLDGGSARTRTVTLGAMNDSEVVIATGLEPGAVVQRHVAK